MNAIIILVFANVVAIVSEVLGVALVRRLWLPLLALAIAPIAAAASSATTGIVASFPLTLSATPAIIVGAFDAHVWVVDNEEQKFIRVDELTGEQTSYAYANGGGFVFAASAGPDGSLWYLDGLNNTDMWKIRSDGRYDSTAVLTRIRSMPGSPVGDELGDIWFTSPSTQSIVRIDAVGAFVTIPVPAQYRLPGLLARDSDAVLWFSTEDGVAWRDRRGHFGGFKTDSPNYLTSCSGGGAAYLSLARETYAHADDYVVGWATTAGAHREVRRWRLPARPTPKPIVPPIEVTCGLCVTPTSTKPVPPRVILLGCTRSMAWVRVGDTIEGARGDGHFDGVAMESLGIVSTLPHATSPRVWIYDLKGQRLIELALR